MTLKARLFDFLLFFTSLAVAFSLGHFTIDPTTFVIALLLYWVFSSLYYQLPIISKKNNTSFDYGISYSLSFAIFTGTLGLLLFETIYRFTVYLTKRWKNTADPGELLDVFYNIGSFVLSNSISYYLFTLLHPGFQHIPFGFWILMIFLVCVSSFLTGTFLAIVLYISGDIKSRSETIEFIFKTRSFMDIGKVAFTNGLLLLLLEEGKWEMIISLFILNYLVNRSFVFKSHSIQNKIERDKFEQMAYTDFLTGIANRAYMDKKMAELNQSNETIAIVVADIDKFKRINDNYNHAVGDRVIQHFSTILKSRLNYDDYLFRSGGEEFTLFLRNRSFETSVALIETISQDVMSNMVTVEYHSESIPISYTASFGLYFLKLNDDVSIGKGYVYADQLLLQSKELGRNKITVKNAILKTDNQ
ncbi:GGDEF domain-containing protein [Heyndrickxia sporothermodurans]|uniref:GGDEF domain-containing protein n=1 Tax=Heyndrickxia sporothermodurans TaxID=46224 RepID=UPI000D33DBD9|nr:GGDEF domain-containing protein [Heyndrickxia sporothermodurans]PTY77624.1 GGDEF domain-containing protein [Heyndrickxia sporothermodurans]